MYLKKEKSTLDTTQLSGLRYAVIFVKKVSQEG